MQTAELHDDKKSREYTIYYPSGEIFTLFGVFAGLLTESGFHPALTRVPEMGVVILDPRGVVTRNGGVVFLPTWHMQSTPEWARKWLVEHPEWPPLDFRVPAPPIDV